VNIYIVYYHFEEVRSLVIHMFLQFFSKFLMIFSISHVFRILISASVLLCLSLTYKLESMSNCENVVSVVSQEVRLIVDHCSSAVLDETIERSVEDRSGCDFKAVVPGEKFLLAPMPVQLGGRVSAPARYPSGLTDSGFDGCIKNLIHNGEVCPVVSMLFIFTCTML